MDLTQPAIELFGLQINEPVTVLTDLLVAAVCLYAFIRLIQIPRRSKLRYYLLAYFFLMFIATATGGLIGHAFLWYFEASWTNPSWVDAIIDAIPYFESHEPAYAWKLPGWITSMLSIMFLERAAIEQVRPVVKPAVGNTLKVINMIELILFMSITLMTLNFKYVEFHSGYGLVFVVLSLQTYSWIKTRRQGNKLFITGVLIASVGALFYMTETGISKWYNHYDISHTFMAVAAWYFYKGSKKMLQ
ncbi:MAG: hypothetical protein R6T91_01965 [Bacteroidales bacterium]